MKKMNSNKGVSLITLVITIIVVIILVSAVIMIITGNNPMDAAKEATFKNNVAQYKSELDIWITTQYGNRNGDFDALKVYADSQDARYGYEYIDGVENIKGIINSMTDQDVENFKIKDGVLRFVDTADDKKYGWAKEVGLVKTINSSSDVWEFNSTTQTITSYKGDDLNRLTIVTIPNQIDGIPVKAIEGKADPLYVFVSVLGDLWDNNNLKEIIVAEGIETIGQFAFRGCKNVTNIDLPESIRSVEMGAFTDCRSITTIDLPSGITQINGTTLFTNCYNLTSVTLPSSLNSIGVNMFNYCTSLQNITIPENVISIEDNAFTRCTSLTSIVLPNSLRNINSYAFYNCSSLASINLPQGLENIAGLAFRNCTSLTQVTVPSSVISIGANTFYGCSALSSITIDKTEGSILGSPWGAPESVDIEWNI